MPGFVDFSLKPEKTPIEKFGEDTALTPQASQVPMVEIPVPLNLASALDGQARARNAVDETSFNVRNAIKQTDIQIQAGKERLSALQLASEAAEEQERIDSSKGIVTGTIKDIFGKGGSVKRAVNDIFGVSQARATRKARTAKDTLLISDATAEQQQLELTREVLVKGSPFAQRAAVEKIAEEDEARKNRQAGIDLERKRLGLSQQQFARQVRDDLAGDLLARPASETAQMIQFLEQNGQNGFTHTDPGTGITRKFSIPELKSMQMKQETAELNLSGARNAALLNDLKTQDEFNKRFIGGLTRAQTVQVLQNNGVFQPADGGDPVQLDVAQLTEHFGVVNAARDAVFSATSARAILDPATGETTLSAPVERMRVKLEGFENSVNSFQSRVQAMFPGGTPPDVVQERLLQFQSSISQAAESLVQLSSGEAELTPGLEEETDEEFAQQRKALRETVDEIATSVAGDSKAVKRFVASTLLGETPSTADARGVIEDAASSPQSKTVVRATAASRGAVQAFADVGKSALAKQVAADSNNTKTLDPNASFQESLLATFAGSNRTDKAAAERDAARIRAEAFQAVADRFALIVPGDVFAGDLGNISPAQAEQLRGHPFFSEVNLLGVTQQANAALEQFARQRNLPSTSPEVRTQASTEYAKALLQTPTNDPEFPRAFDAFVDLIQRGGLDVIREGLTGVGAVGSPLDAALAQEAGPQAAAATLVFAEDIVKQGQQLLRNKAKVKPTADNVFLGAGGGRLYLDEMLRAIAADGTFATQEQIQQLKPALSSDTFPSRNLGGSALGPPAGPITNTPSVIRSRVLNQSLANPELEKIRKRVAKAWPVFEQTVIDQQFFATEE